VGDEGGFVPSIKGPEEACELILKAAERAGYMPGRDICLALDPAATSFLQNGLYMIPELEEKGKTKEELEEFYLQMIQKYPIVSLEDGFAETDWDGFREQTKQMGDHLQIVGDDLFVTNSRLIKQGIREKSANAVLIKLNQIGTVSETIKAVNLCRKAGWNYVISHRSGETEDSFLADFAVAMKGGQIKTGSLCRGERTAKYNRLLEIEEELGDRAVFTNPFQSDMRIPFFD
jgi:enolase